MTSRLFVFAGLWLLSLACRLDPTIPLPQRPQEPLDSLVTFAIHRNVKTGDSASMILTLNLPRFAAVVRQSQTPKGQLDRVIASLQGPTSGTQYLYNQQGQPAGYTSFWPDISQTHATIWYEYKDGHIHRAYSKVYEGEMAQDFVYFVNEFRYTGDQATSMYSYSLDLAKAQAYLNAVTDFSYDADGHVTMVRERDQSRAYVKFSWQDDNIVARQDYYGNNTPIGFGYTYTHDGIPNPLKAFELPYRPVSSHNELTEILKYTDVNLTYQTSYELTYDAAGSVASSAKVQSGFPTTSQPPTYHLYYLYK